MYKPEFEELDYQHTPLGELILRRRTIPSMNDLEVYEVKLDGSFLMSSLNNATEIALAEMPLKLLGEGPVDVLVGGLGLGHTAKAALDGDNVGAVTVIEVLPQVIRWHKRGMVPLGKVLLQDPRFALVEGDFFAWALDPGAIDHPRLQTRFDAILIDIDHSPEYLIHPNSRSFYEVESLQKLCARLKPNGVFALWSADPPLPSLVRKMNTVFEQTTTHEVEFFDAAFNEPDANTIYIGQHPKLFSTGDPASL